MMLIGASSTALQLGGLFAGITTFFTSIFAFIPNLIAALIILLVGYLIARAISGAIRWAMNKSKLDTHMARTRLGQALQKSGHTLTNIVSSVIFWLIALIVVVYAISALEIPPLTASMLGILGWIPNIIGVAVIVFAGLLIGSWIGKGIENILPRYGVAGARIIGVIVEVLIYLFVFNIAFIQLGVGQGIIFTTTTAMSWGLAAALAIGFGGALLYALREVLPAMVSGTTTVASTLKPGQQVTVEGMPSMGGNGGRISGRITHVGMFNTVVETQSQQGGKGFTIIPNELLIDKPVLVQGEAPQPFEAGVRQRVSDFNVKFENNGGSAQGSSQSPRGGSPPSPGSSASRGTPLDRGERVTYEP